MPIRTVYKAQIEHLQILDEEGRLDEKLARDTLSDEQVLFAYEFMVLCRHLDPELLAGRVRQEGIVASVGPALEGLLRWWTSPGDGREMS